MHRSKGIHSFTKRFFCSGNPSFHWKVPKGDKTGFTLYNSITKEKNDLLYSSPNDKLLTWYSCGPTVYDHSHIGHARCYVQQDIVLRILRHFQVDVQFVMGLTDIDDKIIGKAKTLDVSNVNGVSSILPVQQIAKEYENSFWEDMDTLQVIRPHAITRVSEHMHSITEMVNKLVQEEFAYIAKDGSVYFDTGRYRKYVAEHPIPSPSSLSLDEITKNQEDIPHKKHVADFAVWKASGETSDEMKQLGAEWSLDLDGHIINGRPGWHIECSAMCSKMFGPSLDIHAGGIDLLFPHHCNEVAQSQAYFHSKNTENNQWPHYFFHIGHLYIKGFKMSKSLKNFITIKDFLEEYSPVDMRWFCLQHHYRSKVDFSPDRMEDARTIQKKINNYLEESLYCERRYQRDFYWYEDDHKLFAQYQKTRENVKKALQDDFDTPNALNELQHLMKYCHSRFQTSSNNIPQSLISQISSYITSTLDMFGIKSSIQSQDIQNEKNQVNTSNIIDDLVNIRSQLRSLAVESSDTPISKKTLFELCDTIRDKLHDKRIEIKDRVDENSSTWRIMDEEEYKHSKDTSIFTKKMQEHQNNLLENPPITIEEFKDNWKKSGEFSMYDEEGYPTHDNEGKILSKNRTKKHHKQVEKHQKIINQYQTLLQRRKKE